MTDMTLNVRSLIGIAVVAGTALVAGCSGPDKVTKTTTTEQSTTTSMAPPTTTTTTTTSSQQSRP